MIQSQNGFFSICINFDLTQNNNTHSTPLSPWKITDNMPAIPIFYDPVVDSLLLNSYFYVENATYFSHFIKNTD